MNKEDYVSLEVAKLLYQKGFKINCNYLWNAGTLCPTLYEASKWLRENHNIHIDVKCSAYCKPLNRCDYICEIFALSSHQFIDTGIYHKYEEALNAGILEAFKLI